jgi:hypothetical protein
MGRLPGDKEAPRNAVFDYEPCDACKAKFAQGIVMYEVSGPEHAYTPTGNHAVVEESAVRELITPPELAERVIEYRAAYLSADSWQKLFGKEA